MTMLASSTFFTVLVVVSFIGAGLGALILGVLLVRDWRNGDLW